MNRDHLQPHIDALLQAVPQQHKSPLERAVEIMLMHSIKPNEIIELRLSSPEDCNLKSLAQRALNLFFLTFQIYPTELVAHSTVAALFVASEFVFKATVQQPSLQMLHKALFGPDFTPPPVRIVPDDSLDTRTVAVRFSIDTESEEFLQIMTSFLRKMFFGESEA